MSCITELTLMAAGKRMGSWTGSALPMQSVPCWPQSFLFWPQKGDVLGAAGLDNRLRGRLSAYVEQLLDGSYEVKPCTCYMDIPTVLWPLAQLCCKKLAHPEDGLTLSLP